MSGGAVRDNTVQLRASPCPACGYKLDAASSLDGTLREAGPGDLTICINCGEALAFTRNLGLRKATADEMGRMERDQPSDYRQFRRAQAIIVAMTPTRSQPSPRRAPQ